MLAYCRKAVVIGCVAEPPLAAEAVLELGD
jgi:hypothetical protein